MYFKANFAALLLLASVALSAAYDPYGSVFYERDFDEGVDALATRSNVEDILSSLSTRALIEELEDRLSTRAPVDRHAQAVERCRRILYTARDDWINNRKKVHSNAKYSVKSCLDMIQQADGTRPAEDWQYEDTPPPSPRIATNNHNAGRLLKWVPDRTTEGQQLDAMEATNARHLRDLGLEKYIEADSKLQDQTKRRKHGGQGDANDVELGLSWLSSVKATMLSSVFSVQTNMITARAVYSCFANLTLSGICIRNEGHLRGIRPPPMWDMERSNEYWKQPCGSRCPALVVPEPSVAMAGFTWNEATRESQKPYNTTPTQVIMQLFSKFRYRCHNICCSFSEERVTDAVEAGETEDRSDKFSDLPSFIPKDRDDICFGTSHITNLEQADDIVLLSTTPEGLRRKLDGVYRWCSVNFMLFNASKSAILIVTERKPRPTLTFTVGEGELEVEIAVVTTVTYLGFTLSSTPYSFTRKHYDEKAAKAKRAAGVLRGVQQLVGILPVSVATRLYMALIDPHLTHGCEIAIDCIKAGWEQLEKVQEGYLRNVMDVGALCMLVILFTETGILPIRYRRLDLALRFVQYAMQCPRGHYVREAMEESIRMDIDGEACWLGDLRKSIQALPFQCVFPGHDSLGDADVIDNLRKAIVKGMRLDLQRQVNASPKLYLLHGRLEPDQNGVLNQAVPMMLRHYLKINNVRHRVALSRIILSGHRYGIEALRRTDVEIRREDRLCRLCNNEVETPEHVLLECAGSVELTALRTNFAEDIRRGCRAEELAWIRSGGENVRERLRRLIAVRNAVTTTAAFAYDVEVLMKRLVDW
ncbi:hypothetical protein NMY22_g14215 [Coprinellus aureogranulatus]|nr:hypothetical protein NMY22_g14215 [Coprinellus aureogranulatus]